MAIKGLGFDMMSAYNRIGVNDRTGSFNANNESVKAEAVKPAQNKIDEEFSGVKVNFNFDSVRRRPAADIDDIKKNFAGSGSLRFDYDDITRKSDMDRAVEAMEKDSSLKQYQYFVGDSNIITNDEDGLVFIK